jgi:hypothetical protein
MYRVDYRASRNDLALCSTLPRGYGHRESTGFIEWHMKEDSGCRGSAARQNVPAELLKTGNHDNPNAGDKALKDEVEPLL